MKQRTILCCSVAFLTLFLGGCHRRTDPTPEPEATTLVAFTTSGDAPREVRTPLAYAYRTFSPMDEPGHPTINIEGVQQDSGMTTLFYLQNIRFEVGSDSLGGTSFSASIRVRVIRAATVMNYTCDSGSVTLTALSPRTVGTFEGHSTQQGFWVREGRIDVPYAGAPPPESATQLAFTSTSAEVPVLSTPLAFAYLNFYDYDGSGPKVTVQGVQQEDSSTTRFSVYNFPFRTGTDSLLSHWNTPNISMTQCTVTGGSDWFYGTSGTLEVTALSPRARGSFAFTTAYATVTVTEGRFDVPYAGAP